MRMMKCLTLQAEGQFEDAPCRGGGCEPRQGCHGCRGDGDDSQAPLTRHGPCHTERDQQRLAQRPRLGHYTCHQGG